MSFFATTPSSSTVHPSAEGCDRVHAEILKWMREVAGSTFTPYLQDIWVDELIPNPEGDPPMVKVTVKLI